jgi:hypothetical protein
MPVVWSEKLELAGRIQRNLVVVLFFVVLQWMKTEAEMGYTTDISMNKPVGDRDLIADAIFLSPS